MHFELGYSQFTHISKSKFFCITALLKNILPWSALYKHKYIILLFYTSLISGSYEGPFLISFLESSIPRGYWEWCCLLIGALIVPCHAFLKENYLLYFEKFHSKQWQIRFYCVWINLWIVCWITLDTSEYICHYYSIDSPYQHSYTYIL